MELLMYCLLRHLVHIVPVNSLCSFIHDVSCHRLLPFLDFMLLLNYLFSKNFFLICKILSHEMDGSQTKKENVACGK